MLFGVSDEIPDITRSSGGKDLYLGSHILATGKVLGFAGIVPGSFRKVPEESERIPPDPRACMGCKGGTLALLGQGHKTHAQGEGETLSGRESTCLGRQVSSLAAGPPWRRGLGLQPNPAPCLLYRVEERGRGGHNNPTPRWQLYLSP